MRIILLLCAALALTAAAVPVEEVPAAEEIHQVPVEEVPAAEEIHQVPVEEVPAAEEVHQDGELPVETEVEVVKLLVEGERSSCPFGWSKFGSRCFNFISSKLTWVQAERYCMRYGTNLASIHSQDEYEFVQEVVRGTTGGFPRAWLGGHNNVQGNLWFWSDGTPFLHWFWSYGEPNNYGNRERCVVMNQSGQSRGPWLVGSRRFSPSRRMPRRQQRRRKDRLLTRRLQLRPHWSTPAQSAGHRCLIPRPSSSILRANTPSPPCLLSWQMFKHEVSTGLDLNLDTQ